jgi:hypothetical protein
MATHKRLLKLVDSSWRKPGGAIVEVGSQRERGKGSSYELKQLAECFGIDFFTVDLSTRSYEAAKDSVGECAFLEDGAQFLRDFKGKISILYLDNYDIIYSQEHAMDISVRMASVAEELGYSFEDEYKQNTNSIFAHLEQARAALPKMTNICIIGVDDTQLRNGTWWGKGALVVPFLIHNGLKVLAHDKKGVILGRNISVVL